MTLSGRILVATLIVTSPLAGDGKSVVAVGLAAALRASGSTVRLVRAVGGDRARSDAEQFAEIQGVRSSGTPAEPNQLETDADLSIVEAGDLASAASLRQAGDSLILVIRQGETDDVTRERTIAEIQPAALVINAAPPDELESIAQSAANLGAPVLGVLPQDRLLAAPSFSAMAEAVGGTLAGPDGLHDDAAEWLVVGPISAHGGIPYFDQFPHAAVVTRHDRVDIALGALNQSPAGLILTGGEPTLPYVAERVESEDFALIITGLSTAEAVNRIGDLYRQGQFQGPRKRQRAIDLVAEHVSLDVLQVSATA